MQTIVKCVFLFLFFFFPLLFLIFFAYASQHGLSLLLVVFLTTRMFQFLAECGRRRASWYATTKIMFILHLHLYIFHWISCTICKILGYRAVVEFVWKLRFFLVEILRRELFSMFMRKVILKAVRSTSIQLQKIYQVYFRLPFEYLKFSWRESDEVIIRTRYNQAKE